MTLNDICDLIHKLYLSSSDFNQIKNNTLLLAVEQYGKDMLDEGKVQGVQDHLRSE